jgi:osmoprotectant transport system ATP-binding protein
VVFVSHDIDEAVKMADCVAVMREGRLVQFAPPAELLAAPAGLVGDQQAAVERLPPGDADPVPALAEGSAEPLLDRLTTLRDALSTLFEAGAAYGPVVDAEGRCVGLVGVNEIASVVRRAESAGVPGG